MLRKKNATLLRLHLRNSDGVAACLTLFPISIVRANAAQGNAAQWRHTERNARVPRQDGSGSDLGKSMNGSGSSGSETVQSYLIRNSLRQFPTAGRNAFLQEFAHRGSESRLGDAYRTWLQRNNWFSDSVLWESGANNIPVAGASRSEERANTRIPQSPTQFSFAGEGVFAMKYRKLEYRALIVSEVAAWHDAVWRQNEHGQSRSRDTTRMVKAALDRGIKFIDTADCVQPRQERDPGG